MPILQTILSRGAKQEEQRLRAHAERIAALSPDYEDLSDEDLLHTTDRLRESLVGDRETTLDEALAAAKEAIRREQGFALFDEQLMGALALVAGHVAESPTGSGKTVIAEAAAYFAALSGAGVHVVTVNDYLAGRDADLCARTLGRLGMTVGFVYSQMPQGPRRAAYAADITYGTNSEFGFDYLRDNMVTQLAQRVQRGHHFAIVDEVDSILIDEARTPLIISGQPSESAQTYRDFAYAVRGLVRDVDYDMDETKRTISATDSGLIKIERKLGMGDIYEHAELVNHLQQALKAEYLFHLDRDYVVLDDEVKIVDEFTGRVMDGRRWSDGLHQAVEAKEGVKVQEENQTLATITLQNYFRLYETLSGMTGTALAEDAELRATYDMPVTVIPSHHPVIRKDLDDRIYIDMQHKLDAIVEDVIERHGNGQPVLVGTTTVESSETLSRMLRHRGVPHEVLNAKNHAREAAIIAQAGRLGAVTIATNMAGRGTDILLGGNPRALVIDRLHAAGIDEDDVLNMDELVSNVAKECDAEHEAVVRIGGLAVIGSERHEARRIDNQLRGRSGRQGDPGCSRFYISLDDDLMRRFGRGMDRIKGMMVRTGMDPAEPIQTRSVSRAVERAQGRIEEVNRATREHVLEYDDVLNRQRQAIYAERDLVLGDKDLMARMDEIIADVARKMTSRWCSDAVGIAHFDRDGLAHEVAHVADREEGPNLWNYDDEAEIAAAVDGYLSVAWDAKVHELGDVAMRAVTRNVMLKVMDQRWMTYLQEMDYLREGIGLRGFAQRDPLMEYRQDAYLAFSMLVDTMYQDMIEIVLHVRAMSAVERDADGNEREVEVVAEFVAADDDDDGLADDVAFGGDGGGA